MRLPPGPPARFFGLAAYPAFSGDRIGALARLAREYGDVVLFRLGRQRMALLNLLAQYPDVERHLHEELDTVVGDRLPRADDAANLPYTRRVLAEVMRCYPPAWGIGRRAIEDVEIGGYTIPRGIIVLMSQYLLHHDARFFPEPERFDPDRWLPDRQRTRPRFAYFPFGGGNRVCVGESFAWMEGVLVLATLAQQWRLERVETSPVPMKAMLTLRPARPIRMCPRLRRVAREVASAGQVRFSPRV
jgi:cytochrome P450